MTAMVPGSAPFDGGIAEVRGMVAVWVGTFDGDEGAFRAMLDEQWVDLDGDVILQDFGDQVGVGRYLPGLQVAVFEPHSGPALDLLRRAADFADELEPAFAARLAAREVDTANAFVCLYDYVAWPHSDTYRGLVFLGNVPRPSTVRRT